MGLDMTRERQREREVSRHQLSVQSVYFFTFPGLGSKRKKRGQDTEIVLTQCNFSLTTLVTQ